MTDLQTFHLPKLVTGSQADVELADMLIKAWRTDGILQVAADVHQARRTQHAFESSKS